MKELRKGLGALLSVAILSATSLVASDEFKILPIFTDDSFCLKTELAVTASSINFDGNSKSGMTYGAELSLGCPIFTIPGDNTIRQQFAISKYSQDGLSFRTIAVNPYYFIDLSDKIVVGFGPGFGGMLVEEPTASKETWLFTYQLGAGVKYYFGDALIGVDIRKQWTVEKDIYATGTEQNMDNISAIAKVGYRF